MRPVVTDGIAWSVGLSVCLSATIVSPAETAKPIEMPFGLRTRYVLDGMPIPHVEGPFLREQGRSIQA